MIRALEPPTRVAREFGRAIQGLHVRLGGDPEAAPVVGRWGTQAWREADAGHVCVDVDDAAARGALAASPLVGPAAVPRPLVLERGALYLHRLWHAESTLAAAVRALDVPAPLAPPDAVTRALRDVSAGFPGDVSGAVTGDVSAGVSAGADPADPQQRAVACALDRRLTVLSGGPGTGKTTTLARLLVAYAGLAPHARIVYAAPTGKAAARLAQSLAAQLPWLDPSGTLRARLPAAGQTVHRLLGARTGPAGRSPLDHDLVIVDEASMLDIELAARLCDSIGPQSRLVLAGDRDQLASVEAGAVFADLCAAPLAGVVVLERNYRQQDAPDIGALAARIRDAAERGTAASADWPATVLLAVPSAAAIVDEALAAWRGAFDAIAAGAAPERVLAAYDAHRVLAAMRDGPVGIDVLNRAFAQRVRRLAAGPASADWYAGRLVMVTKNLPGLGLFNGDVGVCMPDPRGAGGAGLVVAFGAADDVRLLPVLQMPACEDAWAMTVHKAQGSEFESVALVPAPVGHPLNTRELVYTGVTRARRRLSVWGSREAIDEAARRPSQRHGRLAGRLAERATPR